MKEERRRRKKRRHIKISQLTQYLKRISSCFRQVYLLCHFRELQFTISVCVENLKLKINERKINYILGLSVYHIFLLFVRLTTCHELKTRLKSVTWTCLYKQVKEDSESRKNTKIATLKGRTAPLSFNVMLFQLQCNTHCIILTIVSVYSINLSSDTSFIFLASFKRSRKKFCKHK